MTNIPQPIKEAAEKYSLGLSVKSYQPICEAAFIAGATHPDTEKYYRERFEDQVCDFLLQEAWKNEKVNFANFKEKFHLYQEQLTNKNTEE